jgi:hypothetical protein
MQQAQRRFGITAEEKGETRRLTTGGTTLC